MGGLGYRESLNVLESAWNAGIRHFDVAPAYGYGEAEGCLGEFMRRHQGQMTVTTKFGIPPAAGGSLGRIVRSVGRTAVRQFPGLKQRLSKASPPAASASFPPAKEVSQAPRPPNPIFCVEEAKKSLYRSLAAFQSERIDVWLLHEVTASDLHDEKLLRFLEDSVRSGVIGTFGAGTDRNHIDDLLDLRPDYCPTLQYEWSIFDPLPRGANVFRMHHRSLTGNFRSLHAALSADKDRSSRWSELVGADLSDAVILAKLMLKAALLLNPESVILFSSKSTGHIEANVALASDDSLSDAALTLYRVLQAEMISSD